MICTFYSFKGGVGRSMALANIAEHLYGRGLKVLMVDFDLEAPGLEKYFQVPRALAKPDEILARRGVIDMLTSYVELRSLPRLGDAREPVIEPFGEFIVRLYEKNSFGGELSIIPAGRRDGGEYTAYAQKLRSFVWDDFYANHDGEAFFEWFRHEAESAAEVVLIDSRTGVSEMSGVCTYQLADAVVMFVAPNRQNLDGTLMMAESLSAPKLIDERGRPLSLLFVPSRVEYGEARLLDEFAREFKESLSPWTRRWLEAATFDDLKLIYVPHYAYMEKVAMRESDRASAADLVKGYERIANALAQLDRDDGALRKSFYPTAATERGARIFISYARGEDEVDSLAQDLALRLGQQHEVFIDRMIRVGVDWVKFIEEQMNTADFVIALLSARSVQSEMFIGELRVARQLNKRSGRPVILPIHVRQPQKLDYELDAYVGRIHGAYWNGPEDTAVLGHDLLAAISGHLEQGPSWSDIPPPGAPPGGRPPALPELESPGGAVNLQSPFYIVRAADGLALAMIARQGITLHIRGARQMGKTSLLVRVCDVAKTSGKRIAFLDCQLFSRDDFATPDAFFSAFYQMIVFAVGLEDRPSWSEQRANRSRSPFALCTRLMLNSVLKAIDGPITLVLDEIEVVANSDVGPEFFSMLRAWHNQRAMDSEWRRLDIVMASAGGFMPMASAFTSPFNVAEVIELETFTTEQVADLNARHGSILLPSEVSQLRDFLGGHPYLVRLALYRIACGELTVEAIMDGDEEGPFGAHLRAQLLRLHADKNLANGMQEVLSQNTCSDPAIMDRLLTAGLVRREGRMVKPASTLYTNYFRRVL